MFLRVLSHGPLRVIAVKAAINLLAITILAISKYTIDTFIGLPKEDKLILDGVGAGKTVHTFWARTISANTQRHCSWPTP